MPAFLLFLFLCLAPLQVFFSREAHSSQRPVVILSVEGGGLRGIIPAVLLAEIERVTGKPITSIVDFFAGTSVGSIVISYLNLKGMRGGQQYSAQDLVNLWPQLGKKIFPKNVRHYSAVKGLTRPQYSKKPLESELKKYLHDFTLWDALKPILITSVDLDHNEIYSFYCEKQSRTKKCQVQLWEAVRASTAAPTFFHLHPFKDPETGELRMLTDGGIVAMTPDALALNYARRFFPGRRYLLISLSTGRSRADNRLTVKGIGAGSLPMILKPFIRGLLTTQIELAKKTLYTQSDTEYHRIDVPLGACAAAMDESSDKNLQCLKRQAEQTMQEAVFERLLQRLRQLNPAPAG